MADSGRQTKLDELRKAASAEGASAQQLFDLANALLAEGLNDEAIGCYRQAAVLRPDFAEAYNNLGVALRRQGKVDDAVVEFGRALSIKLDYADAHNNLGIVLCDRKDWNAAAACFQQAIRLRSDFADAHGNLGNALLGMGQINAAIASFRVALAIKPDAFGIYNNLSNALCAKGDISGALTACRRSLVLNPEFPEAHLSLALLLLLQGEYKSGWREYEWRWKSKEHKTAAPNFPQPQWGGEELNGRTILLHSEQALGDTLQFVRYAPLVAERGGKVVVACQKELVSLIQNAVGVDKAVDRSRELPPFDVHCPLMSLPRVFQTTTKNIPANGAYLRASGEKWRSRVPTDGRRKVGLVWAGGSHPPGRSIELEALARLGDIPNLWLCSLQKGEAASQIGGSPLNITDWTDELHDFSDTAGLISNLDLVLTVDTAMAHLAGGLDKQACILLKFVPDWRWLLSGEKSPWYPQARLFRQPALGEWQTPIAHVVEFLSCKN
jgi:Flp pilus assembly protein TadD